MNKNTVTRVEIFRWKARSDYAILITRKHGVKVYDNVRKSRALQLNLACTGKLENTENHSTNSSVCTVYKPWTRKHSAKHSAKPLTAYFVQIGIDGYLPDSVSAYPTLDQAIQVAIEEKNNDLDGFYPDCRVVGNIRKFGEYEVLIDGRYHHTIRIVAESVNDMIQDSDHWATTEPIRTRRGLELFCENYNQQGF